MNREAIDNVLAALTEDHRSVLALHYLYEMEVPNLRISSPFPGVLSNRGYSMRVRHSRQRWKTEGKQMENLDARIEQALKDATGSVGISDEASVKQDLAATFRGQYRALFMLAWVKLFAVALLLLWSVYEFFTQTGAQAQLAFATLAVICTVTIGIIYTLFWISMNKQMTNREIKRLELQVALLINKLEAQH